jgi:hypothetical protein
MIPVSGLSMRLSLKHSLLNAADGYTRFLTAADQSAGAAADLSWLKTLPGLRAEPCDVSPYDQAAAVRAELSEVLASSLRTACMPTRKAPTLRLAVEALRSA